MTINSPSDPLIGRTVDHYEIVAKLGGGGMGVVYRARDVKLGRPVALKFLPAQWSHDEIAKGRFVREAQAASATNHRNICVIHDIQESDDGLLFIVMALYEGRTLKQKLEDGALPAAEALEIATEVAEGLAKAHAQGVVHRDVKPGNLMVTDDGVKILDFGLAKLADAAQLTIAGSTVGTVAYMSPEQARGAEADARSDVWALGVVLYEMLTGEVPFKGTYAEAILHAIKTEPIPSMQAPGREIPEALEGLVRRALDKDAERRIQTAREFARELRMLQGRSVPLELGTGPLDVRADIRPSPPRWRRRQLLGLGLAAMVVLLVGGAGLNRWMAGPIERVPIAIAPVANHTGYAELDAYRLALTLMLVDELQGSGNVRVVPYPRLLEVIRPFIDGARDMSGREAIQILAAATGARFIVVPTLVFRDGAWAGRIEVRSSETGTNVTTVDTEPIASSLARDSAYRLVAPLAEGVQEYFRANGPGRSATLRPAEDRLENLTAALAFEEGVNAYERMEYAAALAAFERAAAEDDRHPATRVWESRTLLVLARRGDAESAAAGARELLGDDAPDIERFFVEAALAESRGDLDTAEARLRARARLLPDAPGVHLELADFLKRRQDRDQQAVDIYHEVLRLDPGATRPRVDLCQLYTRLNEHPLAEQEAQAALERYRAAGHRGGEGQALLCLGELQRVQGGARLAEARRNIEAARTIFEAIGGPYNLARVYQYLGTLAFSSREYAEAVQWFEQALARSREVGNRPLEGTLLMNLGVSNKALGNRRQALEYYGQAREFYERINDQRRAAEAEVNVAGLLVDYGGNQEEVRRRAANARATLRSLGHVNFEVLAMLITAASHRYTGDHDTALRELHEAETLARERQLNHHVAPAIIDTTRSYIMLGRYEDARRMLEEIVADETGGSDPQASTQLGVVYTRLGDFEAARRHLEAARGQAEAGRLVELLPGAYVALGELAYEEDQLQTARDSFEKAASFWSGELPDAASLVARCALGRIGSLTGQPGLDERLPAAVAQTVGTGRVFESFRCRLDLARSHLAAGRYAQALAALNEAAEVTVDAVGPELRAQMHYWRSRVLDAQGDGSQAQPELARARELARDIAAALPADRRDRFADRRDIRPLFE